MACLTVSNQIRKWGSYEKANNTAIISLACIFGDSIVCNNSILIFVCQLCGGRTDQAGAGCIRSVCPKHGSEQYAVEQNCSGYGE